MLSSQILDLPRSRNQSAFVFYATNDEYAIAVLVFVHLLRRLGIRGDADIVVLHLPLSRRIVERMREMGIVVVSVAELNRVKHRYYRDCFVKLRIFQLFQFERVVFADADAMPLQSLNTLFTIPFDGPIAAPTAYWCPQPYWTTALMVVRPSVETWDRIIRRLDSIPRTDFFEMDLINSEFGSQIHTLQPGFFCLNSEWEDVNRPVFFGDLLDTYSNASVVHFTALGKPWSYSSKQVRRLRPNAHPIFYELWELWRKTRDEIW